jgi:hypothetical protein
VYVLQPTVDHHPVPLSECDAAGIDPHDHSNLRALAQVAQDEPTGTAHKSSPGSAEPQSSFLAAACEGAVLLNPTTTVAVASASA